MQGFPQTTPNNLLIWIGGAVSLPLVNKGSMNSRFPPPQINTATEREHRITLMLLFTWEHLPLFYHRGSAREPSQDKSLRAVRYAVTTVTASHSSRPSSTHLLWFHATYQLSTSHHTCHPATHLLQNYSQATQTMEQSRVNSTFGKEIT